MTRTAAYDFCSSFCNGHAAAASSAARNQNAMMDTALIVAVSICIIILLGVRLCLPPA